MVLKEPAGLKIALGENPKRCYGEQKKTPSTRMATAGMLREFFVKGQNYEANHKERDLMLEPVVGVLKKEIPLYAHAHRADDIMTAVRISGEFDMPLVILHGTEGHKIGSELARRNIPVVSGPHLVNRAKVEMKENMENPWFIGSSRVKVALMTDHRLFRSISFFAAFAHRAGMSEEDALKSITITPAETVWITGGEPGKEKMQILLL